MSEKMSFPNSMVDRITPVTTDAVRAGVKEKHGIEDQWPVVAEPFLQWVIEDKFTNGRPDWDEVEGVLFTGDVEPYEFMKLRLLNSSHSALSYLSLLLGHTHVHSAMADPSVAAFVRLYMEGLVATLDPVPGVDLDRCVQQA
jgi:mannitol 2-dehydrogenase